MKLRNKIYAISYTFSAMLAIVMAGLCRDLITAGLFLIASIVPLTLAEHYRSLQ